jgi:F-type H+-transporting ATPase subunit b
LKHSSFTSRLATQISRSLFVAVLAVGAGSLPVRAHAQEPAPAAPSSGSNAASQPGNIPGKAELSEREENNIYRHTPLVQSMARTFHMDVETTARLFEILNFAILALAVVIPIARIMPKLLRRRKEALRRDLESARKVTADANTRLSAVEAKLAKLDQEISAIRTQVEEESKNDEVRIKSTIDEERQRIVAAAEQEIAAAAASAKRGLRHFAADLAIDQAARQLVLTPETDRALIAEFVADSSAGGKN